MIRMIQSTSSGQAKSYYSQALVKGDYYLDEVEIGGDFGGRLAYRLGLSGRATKEQFFALCDNKHPVTGERLTPRTSSVRTTGYDLVFSVPKSVSILHALSGDDHILKAFRESVAATMQQVEADARVRVRKGGKDFDRQTGELLFVDIVHQTSRPTPGFAPDPHLHAHQYIFNVTYDEAEQQIRAAQFKEINRKMPLYQSAFYKTLSDKLIDAGYQIRRTGKSFEIEGVDQKYIDLFSKRTNAINKVAQEKGITDAKQLDGLGARTRAAKDKGMGMAELKADWRRQIHELDVKGREAVGITGVLEPEITQAKNSLVIRYAPERNDAPSLTAQQCVDFAIGHSFERASVVEQGKLLERAYLHSIGMKGTSLADIETCLHNDSRLIRIEERGRMVCTTKEVLAEEKRMVALAQAGRGKMVPLYHQAPDLALTGQQAEATRYLLTNTDRVSIVRGAAGSGKTTLLKELVAKINKTGKETMLVAPTAQASRSVLRQEGFDKADTVARLLADKAMQEKLKGQVLIVDEAGLLGTKDMTGLISLAHEKQARLILLGDTRQHSSVSRGDALRVLNTVAGIRTAEVSQIHRQKNAVYKEVVEGLSKGQVKESFDKLDGMGAIREVAPEHISESLVVDYVAAFSLGKSALIISPTHAQGEDVTKAVREKLKEAGYIGKKEIPALSLVNENLTVAEKNDWRNYQPGQWVQFNQNMKQFPRGSKWKIAEATEKAVLLQNTGGEILPMPPQAGDRLDVFRLKEIAIAKGDKLRVTKNGFDNAGKGLSNGQTYQVTSISRDGEIKLRNSISNAEYSINNTGFGHITHAHCITSHASQGKTVDVAFIAAGSPSFGATDAKQFYVSVSRARESVHIYTDDKAALLSHVSDMGDRRSALELVEKPDHTHHVHHLQKQTHVLPAPAMDKQKEPERNYPDPYEPTL
ncbi:MobF family relaxase [Taibaiella koreensis]|uniref:MobF family relaxase n=1 Tax=Taibaiella koreensis TaxID=1268548 RepID=UPI000E599B00|nr:MobF family relaxase [Taibaiella koreensis]